MAHALYMLHTYVYKRTLRLCNIYIYIYIYILTAFPLQQWLHERASVLRYTALPVWFCDVINFARTVQVGK